MKLSPTMGRMCLALASLLAAILPAQAATFSDSEVQTMQPQIRAACLKPAPNKDTSWMSDTENASVCTCVANTVAGKLRQASFSSTTELTASDRQHYIDIESAAAFDCAQPIFQRKIETTIVGQCHELAPKHPDLKSLTQTQLQSTCACVASNYAKTYDLKLVSQLGDPKAAQKQAGDLFLKSIAVCKN